MQIQTTSASEIRGFLDSSVKIYQSLLGYSIEDTSLENIPEDNWVQFATQRGLNPNSSGIYLPRNQTAIVRGGNPLSLFHEYFGHGLYCEQSLSGRKLVDLERKLLEEGRQEFSNSRFTLEDLQKFRRDNKSFQELENFRQENLRRYELFAIWSEYLLSEKNGIMESFERKYDSLPKGDREVIDLVINFSNEYGNLAGFYAQGMARRTTIERTKRLLEDIYKDKLKNVRFALLYGSRKKFSDIDVFVVGDNIPSINPNEWLDIRDYSPEEFEWRLKHFDISITDPLFTGEMILGDKDYVKSVISKIQKLSISEEAIIFNKHESERHRKIIEEAEGENNRYHDYVITYGINADALRGGLKLFTKDELLSYSRKRASAEGDKPLQIKGGIEKCNN